MAWPKPFAEFPRPEPFELVELATLAVLSPFIVAPSPVEALAANLFARWRFREGTWTHKQRLARFPPVLAATAGRSPFDIARQSEAQAMRERILVLRAIAFPWWRRRVRLAGLRHVRAALADGRGVILWIHHCSESNVAVKQALWQAGLPLAHLSRPGHPASSQPLGVRWINPLLRRPEVRFLAERVVIDDHATVAPLRRLRALLAANRAVSITVTATASRLEALPLFGGRLFLPTGPVQLAAASGAPLLPVFTYRLGNVTRVEVGSPLPVTGSSPEAVGAALEAACAWLEPRAVAHPEAWVGWRTREFSLEPEPLAASPARFDNGA